MKSSEYVPVTEALYHAARKPMLDKTAPFDRGFCGKCHRETSVAEAIKILTRRFGSWDGIAPDPRSKQRHLCLPCAWAYRAKDLQYHPTIIIRGDTQLHHPSGTELRRALSGPTPTTMAVLFPVSGKKAVAPGSQWGKIATDSGPLTWTRRYAQAVKDLMGLKAVGITEPALSNPAPPSHSLDTLDAKTWTYVQDTWRRLEPLRQDKAIFPTLVKMTREKM